LGASFAAFAILQEKSPETECDLLKDLVTPFDGEGIPANVGVVASPDERPNVVLNARGRHLSDFPLGIRLRRQEIGPNDSQVGPGPVAARSLEEKRVCDRIFCAVLFAPHAEGINLIRLVLWFQDNDVEHFILLRDCEEFLFDFLEQLGLPVHRGSMKRANVS
jgi:hypothetical protein